MSKFTKAVAALMLTMAVVCAAGCKKAPYYKYNSSGSFNGHDYVDLGLPSGTLWATRNVGANSPEDYGDYFAWGETQPKGCYYWSTYQYCNGTFLDEGWFENPLLTKYCNNSDYGYNGFTDNLTTLLPEDDAATAHWGNGWRMPTQEEWQELLDNTTVTWITYNNEKGNLFTARNGNRLFLPAAGFCDESGLYFSGVRGFYSSSSLDTDYPGGMWIFRLDDCYISGSLRYRGHPVRAVRSAQ